MLPANGWPVNGFLIGVLISGEISLAHQRGRNRPERRAERLRAHAFVGAHEECLVVAVIETRDDHRPLDLEAELIAAQRILRIRRVLVPSTRVERIVLEEVEGGPVQRVGAALGHHVDRDAEIRPVLGRCAAGLDLNLFDRIGDRPHAGRGEKVGRGIDAVERQAVLDLPLTGASEAQTDVAVDAREHAGGRGSRDSRHCGHSAAARRSPACRSSPRPSRCRSSRTWRPGFDVHRFGHAADLEHRVGAHDLVAGRLRRRVALKV